MTLTQLANSKFMRLANGSRERTIHEEFGDVTTAQLFAQVKMMFWNNEANLSLRYLPADGSTPTVRIDISDDTKPNRLIFDFGAIEIHVWSLDPDDGQEFGGHTFAIVLKSKPSTNVFNFSVKSKGLTFAKVLALTQAEIDAGKVRPTNVVNSYDLFYNKRGVDSESGKNYGPGMAARFYRIKAIDSNRNTAWGDQDFNIDSQTGDGTYTITVPQAALNQATYPAIIA